MESNERRRDTLYNFTHWSVTNSNSHFGGNCSCWMTIQRWERRILIRLEPQQGRCLVKLRIAA